MKRRQQLTVSLGRQTCLDGGLLLAGVQLHQSNLVFPNGIGRLCHQRLVLRCHLILRRLISLGPSDATAQAALDNVASAAITQSNVTFSERDIGSSFVVSPMSCTVQLFGGGNRTRLFLSRGGFLVAGDAWRVRRPFNARQISSHWGS